MNSIFRILRYGIQGFRRNIWLSVIAIITMTLTITTITVFALGSLVVTKEHQDLNNRIDYNIFIKDSASDADVSLLRTQVTAQPGVLHAVYYSKQDTLKRFNTTFQSEQSLKDVITSDNNPLPREIDIKFTDPGQIDRFNQFITQARFSQVVEDTSYRNNKDLVDKYVRLTNLFKIFALSFTGFFVLIAVLVILNTVRLAIYARREEIEVMRLVGATSGFIRGPFLIEGVFFGVVGALVSGILVWLFLHQLPVILSASFENGSFSTADLFGAGFLFDSARGGINSLFTEAFLGQLLIGLLLGTICSYIAVRRYLRE